jgi:threonine aldolase
VSNALALAALTPSYGKIYCHGLSHVNTDECGAPEFFTGGAKLIPLTGENGKFSTNSLADAISGAGQVHSAQPACVSLTQASEAGTVYTLDEISAIAATAHAHGMAVHMDGARFANALVNLDISPAEMTWKSGVDVLSFGGTKNGCLAAEAIIFFRPELAETFPFLHKRAGQLLSKMRFVSAQLHAYVSDNVWLRNASHANQMATKLSQGLSQVPGIELAFPTQSNEIFAHMPRSVIDRLAAAGFGVGEEELDSTAPPRLVTAWNTEPADIDRLLKVVVGH